MSKEEIKAMLSQVLNLAEWTTEGKKLALQYLDNADESELKNLMQEQFEDDIEKGVSELNPDMSAKIFRSIQDKILLLEKNKRAKVVKMRWIRIAAAACVVGIIGIAVYFSSNKKTAPEQFAQDKKVETKFKNDVLPGGDKAMLTLADGSSIILNNAQNGKLAQQGNAQLIKVNGKIVYNVSKGTAKEMLYNTITTPKGGQYQVELPDGSQVWLNAVSSIRFPAEFSGNKRSVEITGEAYFEVAKNKEKPFVVKVDGSEVEVLGTHFNVNAYPEESIVKTTLLEGSIRFLSKGNVNTLKPGQQSQLSQDGKVNVFDDVNTEDVMAWKNGVFYFQGEDIHVVLRQLCRWYDVEVVYEKPVNDRFFAEMPRNTKLSDILKALELTGKVHFQIDGKKIIVMP
ncbi:MAG: FecR domain-containing protein [Bacteroidota bacterium]